MSADALDASDLTAEVPEVKAVRWADREDMVLMQHLRNLALPQGTSARFVDVADLSRQRGASTDPQPTQEGGQLCFSNWRISSGSPSLGVDGESAAKAQLPQGRIDLMEFPTLAISSMACQARAGWSEPTGYLVPDGIVQYIAEPGCYLG